MVNKGQGLILAAALVALILISFAYTMMHFSALTSNPGRIPVDEESIRYSVVEGAVLDAIGRGVDGVLSNIGSHADDYSYLRDPSARTDSENKFVSDAGSYFSDFLAGTGLTVPHSAFTADQVYVDETGAFNDRIKVIGSLSVYLLVGRAGLPSYSYRGTGHSLYIGSSLEEFSAIMDPLATSMKIDIVMRIWWEIDGVQVIGVGVEDAGAKAWVDGNLNNNYVSVKSFVYMSDETTCRASLSLYVGGVNGGVTLVFYIVAPHGIRYGVVIVWTPS